jgi:hypothetical protein
LVAAPLMRSLAEQDFLKAGLAARSCDETMYLEFSIGRSGRAAL